MRGAPPVLWTAAGFAAGAAAGATFWFGWILIAALPILIWRGPKSRALPLLACVLAGLLWGTAGRRATEACTAGVADGDQARLSGHFTRASAEGASALRTGCGEIRVYTRDEAPPEARAVIVEGRWIRSVRPDGAETVYLSASSVEEGGMRGAVDHPGAVRDPGAGPRRAGAQARRPGGDGVGAGARRARGHPARTLGRLRAVRHGPPAVDLGVPRRGDRDASRRPPLGRGPAAAAPRGPRRGGCVGVRPPHRRPHLGHPRRLDDHRLRTGTTPARTLERARVRSASRL